MSVQVKKLTSSKKRRRRSHDALKKNNLSICSKCKKPVMPHHACKFCGTYKSKEAIKIRPDKEERKTLKKENNKEKIKTEKKEKAAKKKETKKAKK